MISPLRILNRSVRRRFGYALAAALFAIVNFGCQSTVQTTPMPANDEPAPVPEVQTLREGDVLKIAFPGAPNLDTTQQVRRDGRISLQIVGEVMASGMTPTALEQDLLKRYENDLVTKEVRVTVVSSTFFVFVNGAVLRPGKITADRPLSALEAIMEAGGFDAAKADLRAVKIIRQQGGRTQNFTINLQQVFDGKQADPFMLRQSDIVMVPEKFSWF
jgi:polysaccharide biosynthesis/export protein